jgi:hypothetical protein
MLAAGAVVYGRSFNPLITLKALSYFEDVPALPGDVALTLGVSRALAASINVAHGRPQAPGIFALGLQLASPVRGTVPVS